MGELMFSSPALEELEEYALGRALKS